MADAMTAMATAVTRLQNNVQESRTAIQQMAAAMAAQLAAVRPVLDPWSPPRNPSDQKFGSGTAQDAQTATGNPGEPTAQDPWARAAAAGAAMSPPGTAAPGHEQFQHAAWMQAEFSM
eukprot:16351945-Heterocapsa_arctica.AAC.1